MRVYRKNRCGHFVRFRTISCERDRSLSVAKLEEIGQKRRLWRRKIGYTEEQIGVIALSVVQKNALMIFVPNRRLISFALCYF